MPIRFYALSGSPFAWKVWLALEHKGLAYELSMLSLDKGELKTPDFLALNPRGKVPVIVDGGFALAESAVIVEYLEDMYPTPDRPLWPSDARARATARRIAAEADSYLYPHGRTLVRELLMRSAGEPDAAVLDAAREGLARELLRLEPVFANGFIAGSAPSAADYTVYPMLALLKRVEARKPQHKVLALVPEGARAWMGRVEALPYSGKTTPPHWRSS